MDDIIPVYLRVKRYVLKNNLKYNEIAEKSGIALKRLYHILGGNGRMKPEEYEAICIKGLGVGADFFMPLNAQILRNGETS